jgi:hypothetical protein
VGWGSLPPNFSLPSTVREIDCPWEVFGDHLELVPKSLSLLYASDYQLEKRHVDNCPPSLTELYLDRIFPEALSMIPTHIRKLHLIGLQKPGILTRSVCERFESMELLNICLHHLEFPSCLSAFKCLKILGITVSRDHLTDEQQLFSRLSASSKESLKQVDLHSEDVRLPIWSTWITQLQDCQHLESLEFSLGDFCGDDQIPSYLKLLPPSLKTLVVPPTAQSKAFSPSKGQQRHLLSPDFVDCFHHLPGTLTELMFGYLGPILLSDDCFAHLPPTLTSLNLVKITGITERFWQLIPPHIPAIEFSPAVLQQGGGAFSQLRNAYLQKLETLR